MQQYRNRLKIISDLLSVALNSGGEGGASPSVLMRRSNLSYRGLEQLLTQLLSAGFILEKHQEKGVKYVVSAKGSSISRTTTSSRASPSPTGCSSSSPNLESGFRLRHSFRMVVAGCNN